MVDQIFEDPLFRSWDQTDKRLQHHYRPKCDVCESDQEMSIYVNLPGLKKEEIKLDVDELNRTLTLSGEIKKIEKKSDKDCFHCLERPHGSFSRTVR